MNAETVNAIHDMTLEARALLVGEMSEQLEGIYGWLPKGQLEPAGDFPFLEAHPAARETRTHLETFLADSRQAGLEPQQAREKLIKEGAFTWLNRCVAFKMMEARKLVRQTITRGQDSNGFKMWLTEDGNDVQLRDYEAGDLPQDGLGEGPRQRAYRCFLLAQCARLAQEVRVLFDPDNLASRLCPRPRVLKALIELLNREVLQEAWQPGNEETIGWVYQFFVEEQKKSVFDRLYKKKEKIRSQDIPAATQTFTPHWIVTTLVENSLGRLWLQMHPDSHLVGKLAYMVPEADSIPHACPKLVRDIRVLDPACGTMHFGLVAFDLLLDMYQEEIDRAGQPGWPEEPSVRTKEEIPQSILARNLHGIDIDLRSVQLSALTLYLRAKNFSRNALIIESQLACADIHMLDGDRLKTFISEMHLQNQPIYGRILGALQERLKEAEQAGSLLRLDAEIHKLIDEEHHRYKREDRQPDLFGWTKEQFETEAGRQEFWEMLEIQIGQALDAFAREMAAKGSDQGFFAGEATKGLRLLEIMGHKYDVVMTNPPYLSSRNMNVTLKGYLRDHYPLAKADLYAAFIQRCTEWLAPGGRLGMITQQSFMFISSYEKLRAYLRNQVAIETIPHVGPRAFNEVTGEKVNTALLVFRRETDDSIRNNAIGTYFRLVKESDGEAKRARFEQALAELRAGRSDPIVYRYRQGDFDAIPGSPWTYWVTGGIRALFKNSPRFESFAKPWVGLQTSDNDRFLRYWWEVGFEQIAASCSSQEEFTKQGKKWAPHMKGGEEQRWYGNQQIVVNWHNDGREMKAYAELLKQQVKSPPGNGPLREFPFYFKPGVTWTHTTGKGINARIMPPGFICNVEGMACYSDFGNDLDKLALAILNSKIATFLTNQLNPTFHYGAREVGTIPVPHDIWKAAIEVATEEINVEQAIVLTRADAEEDETTYDFIASPPWQGGVDAVASRHRALADLERAIDEEVYRLYGIAADDRAVIEAELAEPVAAQESDGDEEGDTGPREDHAGEPQEDLLSRDDLACQWISYAVGIVLCRFQPGVEHALGRGNFPEETARQVRGLADTDGICVLEEGHRDDLAARVFQALQILLGEDEAGSVVAEGTGRAGNSEDALRRYLEGPFFKEHLRQYRKRPVYWLLQSPHKRYSVWLFHETLTRDTLYRIRGEQYVGSTIKRLEASLSELRPKSETASGRERSRLKKQIDDLEEMLDDLRAFDERIGRVLQRGYTPHLDDGVLINMAPLWPLVPAWQAEPKKCWEALERGDYDWSCQAMDHWPDRVREQCTANRSYAIAHGLAE